MFTAGFDVNPYNDGKYIARTPTENARLSFEGFKLAYGGGPVTSLQEKAKFLNVPPGFEIWKTAEGSYLAVKP